MKIYQAVQKFFVGDTQTDRQTGDLIRLLLFLERRLKINANGSYHNSWIDAGFSQQRLGFDPGWL
jgi:hypothetical protein